MNIKKLFDNHLVLYIVSENLERRNKIPDKSRYKNHGKVGGILQFKNKHIKSLQNGYINCGNSNSLRITNAITIAFWLKLYNLSFLQKLVAKGIGLTGSGNFGYAISYYNVNNRIYFDTYSSSTRDALSAANAINDNNWHFILCTWDGTTNTNGKKIYIDSKLKAQKTSLISEIGTPDYNLTICIDSYYNLSQGLYGEIDEIMIFNKYFTEIEIKELYYNSPIYKQLRGIN